MSLPIKLRPAARKDVRDAYRYYKRIRLVLADEFLTKVQLQLSRIEANPRMHQDIGRGVRKSMVNKYPYWIFYRVQPTFLDVFAVIHTSRDPSNWQSRIKDEPDN